MRVDDQRIRGLSHHLERLVRDCSTVFATDLDREQVRQYVRHAVGDKPGSFVVRVTVFDPALDLGKPSNSGKPKILVTHRPAGALPAPPMRIQTATYVRDLPAVKHIGLFGAVWHRRNA